MSNENLDKLFKNKFENREAPFNEDAWEGALSLIEEQEKKKKRKWLIIWAVLLIGAVSSAIGYYSFNNDNNSADSIALTDTNKPEKDNTQIDKETNKDLSANKNDDAETDNNSSQQEADDVNLEDYISETNKPAKDGGEMPSTSEQQPSSNSGDISSNDDTPKTQKSKNDDSSIGTDDDGNEEKPTLNDVDRFKFSLININTMPTLIALQQDYTDIIPLNDSLLLKREEDNNNDEEDKKNYVKHRLGVVAGFNNLRVLNNTGAYVVDTVAALPADSGGMENQFSFGLAYSYAFNKKWSINIGAIYYKRTEINSYTSTQTTSYGFGYTRSSITEVTDELSLIELPISVQYNVLNNGYIQFGGGATFITGSKNRLLTTESNSFGAAGEPVVTNEANYRNGFNDVTFSLMLGYKHYILPSLSVGVQGVWGLNDMTKDDFYSNSKFDRNVQFRLMLRYDIFKK